MEHQLAGCVSMCVSAQTCVNVYVCVQRGETDWCKRRAGGLEGLLQNLDFIPKVTSFRKPLRQRSGMGKLLRPEWRMNGNRTGKRATRQWFLWPVNRAEAEVSRRVETTGLRAAEDSRTRDGQTWERKVGESGMIVWRLTWLDVDPPRERCLWACLWAQWQIGLSAEGKHTQEVDRMTPWTVIFDRW